MARFINKGGNIMGYDKRSLGPMLFSKNVNYEPQRTNNFQLEVYGLPGQGTEQVMLTIVDFSLPTLTNDPYSINHGNSDVKFAGVTRFTGSDTLNVVDYITTDMEEIIRQWRALVYDPRDDTIGWAIRYKKDGTVTEFGPDGTFYRYWNYKGLWPSAVNYGNSLSHESPDIKKIELTIQYDKCDRNL